VPSTQLISQSGGVQLASGNVYSGRAVTGVFLRLAASGASPIYLGYSGGLTITSGGALASGGLMDGIELYQGQERYMRCGPGGIASIFAAVPVASSGVRLFFDPQPPA